VLQIVLNRNQTGKGEIQTMPGPSTILWKKYERMPVNLAVAAAARHAGSAFSLQFAPNPKRISATAKAN
jgi:hypothetical protein